MSLIHAQVVAFDGDSAFLARDNIYIPIIAQIEGSHDLDCNIGLTMALLFDSDIK